MTATKRRRPVRPTGATEAELRHGIGFRIAPAPGPSWDVDPMASRATEARTMAMVLRSASFRKHGYRRGCLGMHPGAVQAIGRTPVRAGDRYYVAAWPEEMAQGCPAWEEDE